MTLLHAVTWGLCMVLALLWLWAWLVVGAPIYLGLALCFALCAVSPAVTLWGRKG